VLVMQAVMQPLGVEEEEVVEGLLERSGHFQRRFVLLARPDLECVGHLIRLVVVVDPEGGVRI